MYASLPAESWARSLESAASNAFGSTEGIVASPAGAPGSYRVCAPATSTSWTWPRDCQFKYESALKAREARRNQQQTVIKEMKLRPKIDPHDYETKKGHVVRFLKAGDKVKVTIMFRGREQSRPELGFRLLRRLSEEISDLGFVESSPKQDGRNMIMVLAPHRSVKATAVARKGEGDEQADALLAEIGDLGDIAEVAEPSAQN